MSGVPKTAEAGPHLNLSEILPGIERNHIRPLRLIRAAPAKNSHGIDRGPSGPSVQGIIDSKALRLGGHAVTGRGDLKIDCRPWTRTGAEATPYLTTSSLCPSRRAAGKGTGIAILGVPGICIGEEAVHRVGNRWTENHEGPNDRQSCGCRMGGCATAVSGDGEGCGSARG